ncbi:MAG: GGDEF domain-containing protein [Candidatus Eisenbacteria bacterium]
MDGFFDTQTRTQSNSRRAPGVLTLEAAKQFLKGLPYPALWIDPTRCIRWRNKAASVAYGDGSEPCFRAIHGFDAPCPEYGDRCPMVDPAPGPCPTLRHIHRTGAGPRFYLVAPLPVKAEGILVVHLPIEDTLLRDCLTHLYTRTAFEQLVEMQIQLLHRLHQGYSVVMADVDHLKMINDQFGHAAGDSVIATAARTIASSLRATDCVGRWGGDEFCCLLPSASLADARRLVRRIAATFEDVRVPEFPAIPVRVSFGVAAATSSYDLSRVIRRADRALYRAKQNRMN